MVVFLHNLIRMPLTNVLNVRYHNVMDVSDKNRLFSRGEIERDDLWPLLREKESKALQFRCHFGLDELPQAPGLITVRGPRQYGKSTWLELMLYESLREYGKGSAYYLNGDELASADDLARDLIAIDALYAPKARVKRLFIDEVTALSDWERAVKRVLDRGHLRDVLIVTTGSKAADLRHGAERLPGRKGRLARSEFIFLPVSYRDFHHQAHSQLRETTWIAYLLTGGSPVALNDIYQFERLPEYFIQMTRDWVLGETVATGRSRLALSNLLGVIFRFGTNPVGFAKLAREAGLANNTVAAGYIEQLSDLLCLMPSWPWDPGRRQPILRKPCKFHFINLAAAVAFHPKRLRTVADFQALDQSSQGQLTEWLVAQEVWRRSVLHAADNPERVCFWQSREHEIDFVTPAGDWIEVKRGATSALEFSWFSQNFPRQELTVVGTDRFEARHIRGVDLEYFLLSEPKDAGLYSDLEPVT